MKSTSIAASSLVLALSLLGSAEAQTQTPPPAPAFRAEKCYAIHAAGKNDCAAVGQRSCVGESKVARDPASWIYVPVGTCEKIVGGSLTPRRA